MVLPWKVRLMSKRLRIIRDLDLPLKWMDENGDLHTGWSINQIRKKYGELTEYVEHHSISDPRGFAISAQRILVEQMIGIDKD